MSEVVTGSGVQGPALLETQARLLALTTTFLNGEPNTVRDISRDVSPVDIAERLQSTSGDLLLPHEDVIEERADYVPTNVQLVTTDLFRETERGRKRGETAANSWKRRLSVRLWYGTEDLLGFGRDVTISTSSANAGHAPVMSGDLLDRFGEVLTLPKIRQARGDKEIIAFLGLAEELYKRRR